MPPRLPSRGSGPVSFRFSSTTTSTSSRPVRKAAQSLQPSPNPSRAFSQTCQCQVRTTRLRREFFGWLNGPGRRYKEFNPTLGPTYLPPAFGPAARFAEGQGAEEKELVDKEEEGEEGEEGAEQEDGNEAAGELEGQEEKRGRREGKDAGDRDRGTRPRQRLHPYPLNTAFQSEPVLSEALRERLWREVVVRKKDIMVVGARYNVSNERVAAVARLKQVEKDWEAQGKELCMPYADAVMAMLPQTALATPPQIHEPVNDLPVHAATRQQLFIPTSESRMFTRADAAKAFSASLKPADERIPNPAILFMEKLNREKMDTQKRQDAIANYLEGRHQAQQKKEQRRLEKEAKETKVVKGRRWDFKFTEVNAELVARNGRSVDAVGWRYGMPHQDRKRGQWKIQTSVD